MSYFIKSFADTAKASLAARRSVALREQSLSTPPAEARGRSVRFKHIEGVSGLALMNIAADKWLKPLAKLHGCTLPDIPPLDPFRRIRTRMHLGTSSDMQKAAAKLCVSPPRGETLLHGDFHLGQLIQDGEGRIWMIDLDDLCIGPPEADIGNLVANLATQETLPGSFHTRLHDARDSIVKAWSNDATPLNRGTLEYFIAVGLIRRHLKLREAARCDFEREITEWVIPVADRISPSDSAEYHG